MSLSRFTFDATADNFRTLVLENSDKGRVLVNYWSPRAGPCMVLMPRLVRLATEYAGRFLLVMLNTDELGQLAREHGVNSLPTMKMFWCGRVVDTLHGAESEPALRKFIDKHVGRPADAVQLAAVEAYEAGHMERATALAAEAALEDTENLRIPASVAKLLIQQGRYREAHDLPAALPAPMRE
jgi:putative thioredoxin